MKILKIVTALWLSLTLVGVAACNPFGDGEETKEQLVEVSRGDMTISVNGNGNIETSRETKLNFGSGGTVESISVEEGDEVSKGKVLASLETVTLELEKSRAQLSVTQAKTALTQAEITRQTAEQTLENTRDRKKSLELALLQAQINLRTAEHTLDETRDIYTWPDIETAKEDVEEAKAFVEYVSERLDLASTPAEQTQWTITLTYAQARLASAETKLDAMIKSYDTEEVAIAKLKVDAARMAEEEAQKNLDKLEEEIALAELQLEAAEDSVEQVRQSLALSRQSLDEAQRQLDEAVITAPFDGVVAAVYVKTGDIITSPSMAPKPVIQLIDPEDLELTVELDEIDVPEVKPGREAVITLDALPETEFTGKVTKIFPVPSVVGGVVLYSVKISIEVPEDSGVKTGMSASADIIITERKDVLLIPDRAIETDDQGRSIVKVMTEENQLEERQIVTGISDGFFTEVISGLSEGEKVLEPRAKRDTSGTGLF